METLMRFGREHWKDLLVDWLAHGHRHAAATSSSSNAVQKVNIIIAALSMVCPCSGAIVKNTNGEKKRAHYYDPSKLADAYVVANKEHKENRRNIMAEDRELQHDVRGPD